MFELPPGSYPKADKFYVWLVIRVGKLLHILSTEIKDNFDADKRSLPKKACIVWTRKDEHVIQGFGYSETDYQDRVVVSTSATGRRDSSPNRNLKAQANAIRCPLLFQAFDMKPGQELPQILEHEYGNCGEHASWILLNHDNVPGSLLCLAFNLDAVKSITAEPKVDDLDDISKLPPHWFSIFCRQCRMLATYAPSSDPAEKVRRVLPQIFKAEVIGFQILQVEILGCPTAEGMQEMFLVRSKEPSSGYGQHSRQIYPSDTGMISQRRTVNDGNVLTSNVTQEHDIDRISSTMEGLRLQDSRPYSGSVVNIPPPSGSAALRRDATSFTTAPDAYGHPDNSTQYKPRSDYFSTHTDSQQESTQREPRRRHREVPPSLFPYGYDSTLPPRDQGIDHGPSDSESNASGSRHHARYTSDRHHAGSSFPTDHSSGPSSYHYAAQGFTQSVSAPPADSRSCSGQRPQLHQSRFSSASGPITMHAPAADLPTGSIHYNDAVTEETGTVQQHNVSTAAGHQQNRDFLIWPGEVHQDRCHMP
ncbi:hypothetical protein K474DRAFT_1676545 [Panus rudis PR-1116 ss-1]|nr:hypothetical protein K474DRAFT_1676545 [Panus rudis PR-1116 ss-1]